MFLMFSLFKKTHQQRYNMHLNLKRTKIQQFEHKIKQKSNFVDNSQVTIYTKRTVLKRFTTTWDIRTGTRAYGAQSHGQGTSRAQWDCRQVPPMFPRKARAPRTADMHGPLCSASPEHCGR